MNFYSHFEDRTDTFSIRGWHFPQDRGWCVGLKIEVVKDLVCLSVLERFRSKILFREADPQNGSPHAQFNPPPQNHRQTPKNSVLKPFSICPTHHSKKATQMMSLEYRDDAAIWNGFECYVKTGVGTWVGWGHCGELEVE